MKWASHIAIAAAPAALIAPATVPAAILGATAPDWLESAARALGIRLDHRGPTHYVLVWVLLVAICWAGADWRGLGLAFALGGLSHVIADALTVTGVPVAPWSDRNVHLFGGRLRTGEPAEYFIAGLVVLSCVALAALFTRAGWYPYFFDWGGYYNDGLLDGSEWKARRWQLI